MYQFDESLRHNHCFTLDIIPELMNGNQDLAKYLSNFCGCGYGGYDFKLRYDGTAVHCQNSVGMLKNSSLVNRNDLSAQLHLNLIKKNYFPNFLTDSEKDIESSRDIKYLVDAINYATDKKDIKMTNAMVIGLCYCLKQAKKLKYYEQELKSAMEDLYLD